MLTTAETVDLVVNDGQSVVFLKCWMEWAQGCDHRRIRHERLRQHEAAEGYARLRDGWIARCERYTEALGPRLYHLPETS